ncbi:MAG: lactate utilization protein C [Gemmatimonadales bacterium]
MRPDVAPVADRHRERILGRVRDALRGRPPVAHPGPFESWRPRSAPEPSPVALFTTMLESAGGEVVRVAGGDDARAWLAGFSTDFASAACGETLPAELRPLLPSAPADAAPLGVSLARGAVAETGSLLLDARDGRRAQLLPPTHVVMVHADAVHATFRDALLALRDDLPSAIGLHSGPSKSADIGHIMVKGVHGPGRLIAVVIGAAEGALPP